MKLQGKVIAVCGSGGLIGRSIVGLLLSEGARVAAFDVSPAALVRLETEHPGQQRLMGVHCDITKAESIQAALAISTKNLGAIDGAVNCAYPRNAGYGRKLLDITYEDFSENLSLHLGGYFLFMQQCARHCIDTGHPLSLVNFSSVYGVIAPRFDIYEGTPMTMPAEYAAIKSGLIHLSKYFSAYLRGTPFRVNCLSPGGILDAQPAAFLDQYRAHCHSKGMLDPVDLHGALLFLLSEASHFVVGQNLIIDDGFTN